MAVLVKTIDGLAFASVKTRNGLAVASVKSVNGLDTTSGGGSGASEDFTTDPGDITVQNASFSFWDSSFGNPLGSWQSDAFYGWRFNSARFYRSGDFVYTIDLYISGVIRNICNVSFWINGTLGSDNGFCFRVQTQSADGGVFVVTSGSHTQISPNNGAVAANEWYRLVLTMVSTTVSWTITRLLDSSLHSSGSYDLSASIDGSHPTSGYFGQKQDGAGTTLYFDNISLV